MNALDIFIDTNILIYAHDKDAGRKHTRARSLISRLWDQREVPWLSVQVLQEMHVNLTRKGVPMETSVETVSRYLAWRVVSNTPAVLPVVWLHLQVSTDRHSISPFSP